MSDTRIPVWTLSFTAQEIGALHTAYLRLFDEPHRLVACDCPCDRESVDFHVHGHLRHCPVTLLERKLDAAYEQSREGAGEAADPPAMPKEMGARIDETRARIHGLLDAHMDACERLAEVITDGRCLTADEHAALMRDVRATYGALVEDGIWGLVP